MVNEIGKWALLGAAIALVLVVAGFSYYFLYQPVYTPEQKVELNKQIAANCSVCLETENSTCTFDTLQQSHWGVICDQKYVRNCSATCRTVT